MSCYTVYMIKLHWFKILGMVAPVVVFIATIASIYLPGLFIKPQYDFLYFKPGVMNSAYRVEKAKNGVDVIKKVHTSSNNKADLTLYVYDVSARTSREISFEDAELFSLDGSSTSPDGFTIIAAGKDGRDYSIRYLQNGSVRKKIDVQLSGPSFFNFQFIGWINQDDL